jgi:hypothetical protein
VSSFCGDFFLKEKRLSLSFGGAFSKKRKEKKKIVSQVSLSSSFYVHIKGEGIN